MTEKLLACEMGWTTGKQTRLSADNLGDARVFTVSAVSSVSENGKNSPRIEFVGEELPFIPCLTVTRIIAALWGDNAALWVGRSMRLYVDHGVMFGKDIVGGVRVSEMSGISKPATIRLTTKLGKKSGFVILPLFLDFEERLGLVTSAQGVRDIYREALVAMQNDAAAAFKAACAKRANEIKQQCGEEENKGNENGISE